jgi:hypothetical protein
VLSKLQITLCILAGVAIFVFFLAIITNAQPVVAKFGAVPGWQPMAVWGSFGVIVLSSLGVIATQILEFREPTTKKAKPAVESETPADELAAVGATADAHAEAGETEDVKAITQLDAPAEGDVTTEFPSGEEIASEMPNFDDFTSDFTDFKEEE